MLEIKNITKVYETDGFRQKALDDVSVNFRKTEFASILGPSGSGKTTFLNIIGGLDHYTDGDLIINEISTKQYKNSDWDSYRNHRIGFVFQSYNLIGHQSVLRNVQLALTLSGISKKESIERAKKALIDVGLEEHMYKRPNQLSGGQMQRVAIARALMLDPDVLFNARAIDEELRENGPKSPLHDIPLLIKENIDVRGLHTTAGSLALADLIASEDAPLIKKLRDAGALILGKANLSEFAYFMSDENAPSGYSSRGGQVVHAYVPENYRMMDVGKIDQITEAELFAESLQ